MSKWRLKLPSVKELGWSTNDSLPWNSEDGNTWEDYEEYCKTNYPLAHRLSEVASWWKYRVVGGYHRARGATERWWQRRTRGWDDSDIWSLDFTIAKFVLPRLVLLRERKHGYPCVCESEEAWDDIMLRMIAAFEWLAREDRWSTEAIPDYVEDGLDLFRKYFHCLWD